MASDLMWRVRRRVDPSTTTLVRPTCVRSCRCRCRTMAQTCRPAGRGLLASRPASVHRARTHLCPCMDVDGSSGYGDDVHGMHDGLAGRTQQSTHEGDDRFCLFCPVGLHAMQVLASTALSCSSLFSSSYACRAGQSIRLSSPSYIYIFLQQSSPSLTMHGLVAHGDLHASARDLVQFIMHACMLQQ